MAGPARRRKVDRTVFIPIVLVFAVFQIYLAVTASGPLVAALAGLWFVVDVALAVWYWRRPVVERRAWGEPDFEDPWEDDRWSS